MAPLSEKYEIFIARRFIAQEPKCGRRLAPDRDARVFQDHVVQNETSLAVLADEADVTLVARLGDAADPAWLARRSLKFKQGQSAPRLVPKTTCPTRQ